MRYPILLVILLTTVLAATAVTAQGTSPLDEGAALLQEGRFTEAIPLLEQAVAADPDNAIAWSDLGVVLTQVGRTHEAVQAAERALEIDASIAAAHYALGLAWGQLGNGPGAITEQDWLYANDTQLAAQLTAELVEIDPSYDRIDTSVASDADPTERPVSAATIGEMPVVPPADLEPEDPGDSITLLGVTADRAYPFDGEGWSASTIPDMIAMLESWFNDFAGLGEEGDPGSASGEAGHGQNE